MTSALSSPKDISYLLNHVPQSGMGNASLFSDDSAVGDKSPPSSWGKDIEKQPPIHGEKVLESRSVRTMPFTTSPTTDHFHVVKNKLKQNTPAIEKLPTTRRNPRDASSLLIIVVLSMVGGVSVLYFISPLVLAASAQKSSLSGTAGAPPPLLVYFVVSGSVPVPSSALSSMYAKYLDTSTMTIEGPDSSIPTTDHVIQFTGVDLESLKQITRALLADDLMKIGVASAKIRASSTVTLLCSSLFISEYCGQTWASAGCPTGKTGAACDECLPGRFGSGCQPCPNTCLPHGVCDGITGVGRCICERGWDGPSCNQAT